MEEKKNGFTIVELLAVLVVLAIIITIASMAIFSAVNQSRKKMASEVRKNLQEVALMYVMENFRLEKCSVQFSEEIYENQDISDIDGNANCLRQVTVKELKDSGLFEEKRDFCNDTDVAIVYRYNNGQNSEYKSYVSDNACNK